MINEHHLCIPRVNTNISTHDVRKVFEKIFGLNSIGDITRRISSNKSISHCPYFIHVKTWKNDPSVNHIKELFLQGKAINIVYSGDRFWKCSAARQS